MKAPRYWLVYDVFLQNLKGNDSLHTCTDVETKTPWLTYGSVNMAAVFQVGHMSE